MRRLWSSSSAARAFVLALYAGSASMAAGSASIRSLPVPAVTIYPGQVIGADQITTRRFQTTPQSLSGVATGEEEVIGKESRRRLIAGRPISLSLLTQPVAVRRGDAAVAFYRESGFSISTPVVALEDGAAGDTIDARAAATGAVIQVEVQANGELVVLGE
jgi:flagella basal body P-ring formation protein FlgA